MKFGVVIFPGSNCDHDCYHVIEKVCGKPVEFIWHEDTSLAGFDAVILPGGFSYGDYMRTGAIARFSPVMAEVRRLADRGGLVIGICNGFQILTESGLLPGVLMRNTSMKYICRFIHLRTETTDSPFTNAMIEGQVLHIPIGHGDGNYFADEDTLRRIEDNGQIAFRYCNEAGRVTPDANPNGSQRNIAGVLNEKKNVLGMMPHPDRSSESILGSTDGLLIFQSMIRTLARV